MALTFITEPAAESTINAPLVYVCDSDNTAQPNFKYIFQIEINSVIVHTAKVFPNDDGYGVYDVAPILRDYINANYFRPFSNDIIIDSSGTCSFGDGFFQVACEINVGEEYGGVEYLNLAGTAPTYYNTSYIYDFELNTSVMTDYVNQPLIGNYNLTASGQIYYRKVGLTDNHFIMFHSQDTSIPVNITPVGFDNVGTGNNYAHTYTVTTPKATLMNIGPAAINAVAPGTIDENVKLYSVEMNINGVSHSFPVYTTCNPKYTNRNLHYLNGLGAYETKDFRLVSKKSIEVERKGYQKLPYSVSSAGAVSFTENGKFIEQKATYAVTGKQRIKLTTDFMNDAEYRWLSQLIMSPIIYLEQNGNYYPVQITNNNYDYVENVWGGLKPLELELEYSSPINAQFR